MKLLDKLKKQRYDISMQIITLENQTKKSKLTSKQEMQLTILRKKEEELDNKINHFKD